MPTTKFLEPASPSQVSQTVICSSRCKNSISCCSFRWSILIRLRLHTFRISGLSPFIFIFSFSLLLKSFLLFQDCNYRARNTTGSISLQFFGFCSAVHIHYIDIPYLSFRIFFGCLIKLFFASKRAKTVLIALKPALKFGIFLHFHLTYWVFDHIIHFYSCRILHNTCNRILVCAL